MRFAAGCVASRSSSVTKTVEGPRPFTAASALFEIPSGFKMHKPEITRPSLSGAPSSPGI